MGGSAPRSAGKEIQDVVIGIIVACVGVELGNGSWDAVDGEHSERKG